MTLTLNLRAHSSLHKQDIGIQNTFLCFKGE
ncbi:hypothetical protein E2C01_041573 [Portunus trituberculatus]|uniref:Uncharacterized protein n=1 Tax=Portunus trituberculatus TaxID=210409 RepID=A0A5B7FR03_PORTR|nr:hypothetical protein [Portunus trituberculatus]